MPCKLLKSALLKDVRVSLEKATDDILEIANAYLKDEGLICRDCQLVCIQNKVEDLRHLINGMTEADII